MSEEEKEQIETNTEETTPQEPQPQTVTAPVSEVSQAQPDHEETLQFRISDFANILNDQSKDRSKRMRAVFTEIHAQDATFLNDDDRFNPFRRELAKHLDVSASLVNKCRDQVLHVNDTENNAEPEFPDRPAGAPVPAIPTAGALASTGGAPFVSTGAIGGQQTGIDNPDAPFDWTKKKTGKVMKLFCNMPGWFLEEWIPITEAEEKDLGDSFQSIFQENFATNSKASNMMYIMACMEAIMRPRLMATMQYRLGKNKDLEAVRKRAKEDVAREQEENAE